MNTEIKKAIIENEMRLLEAFPEYASSIKQFIPKLELINRDMDLYKRLQPTASHFRHGMYQDMING